MHDVVGVLERLLPARTERDVFAPARRDIEILHLDESAGLATGWRRRAAGARRVARLLVLFLDCWRVLLLDLPRSLLESLTTTARGRRKRNLMFSDAMRHAFRRLLREPAFTLAATLTLALGVGANVAVFAVLHAVLLRPLPYADAERLVIVKHRDDRTGITKEFIAIGDYVDMAGRQSAFETLATYGNFQMTLYDDGEPLQLGGLGASPELLEMLGGRPVLGRAFTAEDALPGTPAVVMLGWQLWRDRFGGDPAIVGRSVRIGSQARTVVGIAPRGFRFPPTADTDVILPQSTPAEAPANRKAGWVFAVARLRPDQTVESAAAQLATLSRSMEAEHPEQNQGSTYYAEPLRDALVGSAKGALVLLQAAVVFVLLIACANVANLQLARSLARKRETAVRLALGAGRGQLAGLFLAESLALALLASIAGVTFAYWGVRALVTLVPASVSVPGLSDVRLSGPVLAFTLAVGASAAVLFGVLAAATVRVENARDVLVSAGRATMSRMMRRATSSLVVAEIALAIVLLTGAGLVLRSFASLLAVDPGFRYDDVFTMQVQLPADRYAEVGARVGFYAQAFDAIRALPGVEEMGAAVVVPLTGNNWTVPFERQDRPVAAGERPPDVGWQVASGGYFRALGIPLRAGRLFDESDGPDSRPVVIVSESIERQFFAGESAVGRLIRAGDGTAEVVGVVGDIRRASLDDQPRADLYFPFERQPSGQITLFIRTADAAGAAAAVRAALRRVEPNTAILSTSTFADIASESVRVTQLMLWLLGVFAMLAVVLAAVGIYGLMSYVIRQRSREIGTRMAVGATRGDVARLVLRQGALIAVLGIGGGLAIGVLATRSLRSVLFGVSPWDPMTLGLACAVLAATTLAASWIPARRAAAVDPARVLSQP